MTTNQTTNINKKLRLNFFLLIPAVIVGTFLSGPDFNSMDTAYWIATNAVIAIVYIIPLLFFIPTVNKPTIRNISWLGFFLLAYLLWGIVWPLFHIFPRIIICGFIMSTFIYVIAWLRPHKKEFKKRKKEMED